MKGIRKWFESHINSLWYESVPSWQVRGVSFCFLSGCSVVYQALAWLHKYVSIHFSKSAHPKIPVIVIGNLTVGGTGKTPLVIALAEYLKQGGYRPGIVSRGYGGKAKAYPLQVTAETSPVEVGDEAVLLSRRTQVSVVVAPKRVQAIDYLLNHSDCNIILSDDGLQHWPMKRDVEILVIDGKRRFGNARCLPAGPLREPLNRYKTVDFLVVNEPEEKCKGEYPFHIHPECFVHIGSGEVYSLDFFEAQKVNVVTAIGHPQRFLDTLKNLNIDCEARIFPDHHIFERKDFLFEQNTPIIMTEKDAVKCEKFEDSVKNTLFYLKITPKLDSSFKEAFMKKLNQVQISLQMMDGKSS
jgi:tetraacyldisaccharide 4'-kinase